MKTVKELHIPNHCTAKCLDTIVHDSATHGPVSILQCLPM